MNMLTENPEVQQRIYEIATKKVPGKQTTIEDPPPRLGRKVKVLESIGEVDKGVELS